MDFCRKTWKEIGTVPPIGLTYYPDGHWELWYGEDDDK